MRQLSRRPMRACFSLATVAALAVPAVAFAAPTPAPRDSASASAATSSPARSVMYGDAAIAARAQAPSAVARQSSAADAVRMERHVGAGKNAALMIVGAAGIVTGAIVGGGPGTAIAIGGAVLGLYGLYNFVK